MLRPTLPSPRLAISEFCHYVKRGVPFSGLDVRSRGRVNRLISNQSHPLLIAGALETAFAVEAADMSGVLSGVREIDMHEAVNPLNPNGATLLEGVLREYKRLTGVDHTRRVLHFNLKDFMPDNDNDKQKNAIDNGFAEYTDSVRSDEGFDLGRIKPPQYFIFFDIGLRQAILNLKYGPEAIEMIPRPMSEDVIDYCAFHFAGYHPMTYSLLEKFPYMADVGIQIHRFAHTMHDGSHAASASQTKPIIRKVYALMGIVWEHCLRLWSRSGDHKDDSLDDIHTRLFDSNDTKSQTLQDAFEDLASVLFELIAGEIFERSQIEFFLEQAWPFLVEHMPELREYYSAYEGMFNKIR